MNWIKAKKKSCESENPDLLNEPERNPNNRYFIPDISGALHDRRFDLWPLLLTRRRQKRKGSLKQWACVLLKDKERI